MSRAVVLAGTPPMIAGPRLVAREIHEAFGPTMLDQGVYWRGGNESPALRRFLALLADRYGRTLSARPNIAP